MRRKRWWLFRGTISLFACSLAWAQAQVHPPEPSVNLGQTTFLDAQGGPGLLIEEIGDRTQSGRSVDGNGRSLGKGSGSRSLSGITHIAWTSNRRLFGAWYGVEVLTVASYLNAGAKGDVGGLGDLTVSPFILQWKELKIENVRLQQRVDVDLIVPVGRYSPDASTNLSSHTLQLNPYYAFTLLPAKHLETSWRIHYLWNGTNGAPSFAKGASSTRAGQALHFNATAGYGFRGGVWLGVNAYYLRQITRPEINDVPVSQSPEQIASIGPGLLWDRGHYLFYVNAFHEAGARNRPEGDKLVFRIAWVPRRTSGGRTP